MSKDKTMHFCETIEAVTPATEEMRHLLDEREINYCDYYRSLTYFRLIPDVEDDFFTTVEETRTHRLILKVGFKSPKQVVDAIQAIAATLGSGTCKLVETEHEQEIADEFGKGTFSYWAYDCSECGYENAQYGRFCAGCGRKVVDEWQ